MTRLAADPRVDRVEPNYVVSIKAVPNDPGFSSLWGLNNTGQSGGTSDADIDAPEAWDLEVGNSPVIVAGVDTGIDYNHPDLAPNMWVNIAEIPGNGIDDDVNGYIDDEHGYDFINNDANPLDDNNHGTHVAGTIGAVGNNGTGVTGVNWHARVMALKFLGADGTGLTSDAIRAILYATDMGASVINASWGGGGYSQALADAISTANDAGVLFVAAAGNGGNDKIGDDNDITPYYPASFDLPNILSVAATDRNDAKAGFSNYGANSVDLGAPGVSILSTIPGNSYAWGDGTSMATPHVTGAASLMFAHFPGLSHTAIKYLLMANVDSVPSMAGTTVSGGRLNLFKSLQDAVVPATVTDLETVAVGTHTATLAWTATGDDGIVGNAVEYDLRYSTAPIDAANFAFATRVMGVPPPQSPGNRETYKVLDLAPGTLYYFALKVMDGNGNASALSNVVSGTTKQEVILFSDDMESGSGNWTISGSDGAGGPALWHISERQVQGVRNNWFYYGIEKKRNSYSYDNGARNYGAITSIPIDLTWMSDGWLRFVHYLETENQPPNDTARVQVSQDNGLTWHDIYASAMGTSGVTEQMGLDLSEFDGQVIRMRFDFDTLNALANNYEGWRVDDVMVTGVPLDTDGDGVPDYQDNCTLVANADQRDTNGDGFGNICDGDFNGDLSVSNIDFSLFKQEYGKIGAGLDADLNGDEKVSNVDFSILKQLYGKPPGPSGIAP